MDRREALKKLGVGSAVAIGTPLILDTFNVASAASCGTLAGYAPNPSATGTVGVINFSIDLTVGAPPPGYTGAFGAPSIGVTKGASTQTTVHLSGLVALVLFTIPYTVTGNGRTFSTTITVTLTGLIIGANPSSAGADNCM